MGKKTNKKSVHKLPTVRERLEVTVDSVAFGGSGVSRVRELVIFIPFAVDEDKVEIEITEVRRSYARGRICRMLKPSPFRTVPECVHYERCGGCQYQHIDYAHQLEIKRNQVIEAFERIGGLPGAPVREVMPSPLPYAYRGKAEFHLRLKPGRPPLIGYKEASESRIVKVSRCEIVDASINRSLVDLQEKLQTISMNRRGVKREERVVLWSDTGESKPIETDVSSGRNGRVIRQVKGKELRVPAQGFFQANVALVDAMVDSVLRACALGGNETVLDAYCGSGLFSLFLATHAKRLFGVDVDEEAIRCACENLQQEGLSNTEFFAGDVAEILKKILQERHQPVNVAVLDPPRIGCSPEVLGGLLRLGPDRIVYISCNPATQARDIRYLLDGGYILKELQPLDMFPQTKHIEVIGLLEQTEML